jgi:hypothetical protein
MVKCAVSHNRTFKGRSSMRYIKIILLILMASMLVILPACTRTATVDNVAATYDPMYTAQAQTVEALAGQGAAGGTPQAGTQIPEPSVTSTPLPSATSLSVTAVPTATTGLLLPTITPAATSDAALANLSYCDAVGFVADVTVPDGTVFAPNAPFTKTWRLKNIGTCTWTTAYEVAFVSGDQMSATLPVKLASNVTPGQIVDISINMKAPANNGTFQGFWALKNASGTSFGMGTSANVPFWLRIVVGTPSSSGYNFVSNAAVANWSSQSGALIFPGIEGDPRGYALKVDNAPLENGSNSGKAGLVVGPNNASNGYVQGEYPEYSVRSGDIFKTIVNCAPNSAGCNVFFRLDYKAGDGLQKTFWSFHEKYEGLYYNASVDLSTLAGQNVKFILTVYNDGVYSANDKAVWVDTRIEGPGIAAPTPLPGACSDQVGFIADVSVPDGTQFSPGTAFTKTWRLKNIGTCTWSPDYKVDFVTGDAMGAVYPVPISKTVAPGQLVDVSVNMKAPATNGTYKGGWALKNASGKLFALGANSDVPFWVQIRVGGAGPTPTKKPGSCTNKAAFVADVTVPDNTQFTANTAFTKTWRLKNSGTCTWDKSYEVVFVSGDAMSAKYPVKLASAVAPGKTADISVNMVAPAVNGIYKGNWGLKPNGGQVFGLGANADVPFYVQIRVTGGSAVTPTSTATTAPSATLTITPTATLTITPTVTSTPTPTATTGT